MTDTQSHIILCNDAELPKRIRQKDNIIQLKHNKQSKDQNVNIQLPDFVGQVYHLKDRIKDLLEIAAYVYAADRKISRGPITAVEFQKWQREMQFIIPVRDYDFWNRKEVKDRLQTALLFMSGDKSYSFAFQKCEKQLGMSLFDNEEFQPYAEQDVSIVLFSGGLDSLTGVIERLKTSTENVCLISHQSHQPETARTQEKLVKYLNTKYNNRCRHYKFFCNLKGERAIEETQRTRSFLYSSIAFALAYTFGLDNFYFYENGVTSINFRKRQDMINARASRTTHPKTIGLLERFFALFEPPVNIKINHPYLYNTKSDIVNKIVSFEEGTIISSSVSCSKTFQNTTQNTHCGICSQCVDRRFAMYSTGSEKYDEHGIYNFDFIQDDFKDKKAQTIILDYIRTGLLFRSLTQDSFYTEMMDQLIDLDDFIDGSNELERLNKLYTLCSRHGEQVELALERMRNIHDKPFTTRSKKSLLSLIANKDYLRDEVEFLIQEICDRLNTALPIAFDHNHKPKDERQLNNMINAIIERDRDDYKREYPSIRIATANTVPDHSFDNLLVESKYLRGGTTPSKATDGIFADISKYSDIHKLFIVYDPDHTISNDKIFVGDIQSKGNCTVNIIR